MIWEGGDMIWEGGGDMIWEGGYDMEKVSLYLIYCFTYE